MTATLQTTTTYTTTTTDTLGEPGNYTKNIIHRNCTGNQLS